MTRRSFVGAVSAVCGLAATGNLHAATHHPREFHVSVSGDDHNDGAPSRPLRTISAAAALAHPGDTITVHAGIYRERVAPPRGGTSDAHRIVYQAAPSEHVVITGADPLTGWVRVKGNVWKAVVPNTHFGAFNPYTDLIHGDWFNPNGRSHHTGAVYLDGDWLAEAAHFEDLFAPPGKFPLWFARVDDTHTTLFAQFNVDPNQHHVEFNVRQTVFYPAVTGINYITVRGFILRQAATPWAPPTAEQIGLIGTHWSKGWVIENNTVSHSICSGIALGKYGDQFDNQSHNTANGYVDTIKRAIAAGWNKENIGHHIVRGNTISHCEQTGIVGSLGAIFSTITGNHVHDIYVRRLFSGAEIAGIKLHAAIDVELSRNLVHHTYRGLWLDWMAQGTHVSRNTFFANDAEDVFIEVDHGPFLVDNNLFLSTMSQRCISQGGAFAHNLFCGGAEVVPFDARMTPYMKAHSTEIVGLHNNPSGDIRLFNNLFTQSGNVSGFDHTTLPMHLDGNVFTGRTTPCSQESAPLLAPTFNTAVELVETADGYRLNIAIDPAWAAQHRKLVTTKELGIAIIPNLPFERADGRPICLDKDLLSHARNPANPFPGPFELTHLGTHSITLWPIPHEKITP